MYSEGSRYRRTTTPVEAVRLRTQETKTMKYVTQLFDRFGKVTAPPAEATPAPTPTTPTTVPSPVHEPEHTEGPAEQPAVAESNVGAAGGSE
jgi:hypothetical protein